MEDKKVVSKNIDRHRLALMIKDHEGLRLFPYRDTMGKVTIGYGRNLDDNGISKDEAEYLFQNDLERSIIDAQTAVGDDSVWNRLSSVRKEVLVNMSFNLGLTTLMKFESMLDAIRNHDYEKAGQEMEDSKWYRQVEHRAKRLVYAMRCNIYNS